MSSQPPIDTERLDAVIAAHPGGQRAVIHCLQAVQQEFGYVPESAMKAMAKTMEVPLASIYGVASFYSQIFLAPRGEHVMCICKGTACHVRGAQLIEDELCRAAGIKTGQTTPDLKLTLETVACVGACALGPLVVLDGEYHGHLSPNAATKLLKKVIS